MVLVGPFQLLRLVVALALVGGGLDGNGSGIALVVGGDSWLAYRWFLLGWYDERQ